MEENFPLYLILSTLSLLESVKSSLVVKVYNYILFIGTWKHIDFISI